MGHKQIIHRSIRATPVIWVGAEGGAFSCSAGGRSKVHFPVLPSEHVGLMRCYGNSCDEGRSVCGA